MLVGTVDYHIGIWYPFGQHEMLGHEICKAILAHDDILKDKNGMSICNSLYSKSVQWTQ